MASQLESLKQALIESEARSGADNPLVKGLKAQIANLERHEERRRTGGFWNDDGTLKSQYQNPCG